MRAVYLPATLKELFACLKDHPEATLLAGGTDLLVKLRSEKLEAPALVGLERMADLRGISEEANNIRIGSCVTHDELLRHPIIAEHLPILRQALATLGSPAIRTMGTIGGNICTASPAGDTLPPLYVLQGWIEIVSASDTRLMPIADFIRGPGKTRLKAGEIVASIHMEKPAGFALQHFEKIGQRKSMACAVASFAALIELSASGEIIQARLAWGSVGPTVVTNQEIDAFLIGKKLTYETLHAAADIASGIVAPIDDLRASADYRRQVSGNLMMRLLQYAA